MTDGCDHWLSASASASASLWRDDGDGSCWWHWWSGFVVMVVVFDDDVGP